MKRAGSNEYIAGGLIGSNDFKLNEECKLSNRIEKLRAKIQEQNGKSRKP